MADIYAGLEATAGAGVNPAGGARDADDAVGRILTDLTRFITRHPSSARAYEVRGFTRWKDHASYRKALDRLLRYPRAGA